MCVCVCDTNLCIVHNGIQNLPTQGGSRVIQNGQRHSLFFSSCSEDNEQEYEPEKLHTTRNG